MIRCGGTVTVNSVIVYRLQHRQGPPGSVLAEALGIYGRAPNY